MTVNRDGISIGTVSGGIVNFGGAIFISPISVTKSTSGAGGNNSGESVTTNTASNASASTQQSIADIIDLIRRSLD